MEFFTGYRSGTVHSSQVSLCAMLPNVMIQRHNAINFNKGHHVCKRQYVLKLGLKLVAVNIMIIFYEIT